MNMTPQPDLRSTLDKLIETASSRGIELDTHPPLGLSDIKIFNEAHSLAPDNDVEQILRYTNGLSVGGLTFCSAAEIFEYGHDMLTVQNWGNGDFDCIITSDVAKWPVGAIVFTNHQSDARVIIAESVNEWISSITNELRYRNTILHPRDYHTHKGNGVYSHVLDALRGTQCELGRWLQRQNL